MPAKKKSPNYRILSIDPWLKPYSADIGLRMRLYSELKKRLLGDTEELSSFANGYMYYGINRTHDGWVCREWLPEADEVHLIGEFNDWNRLSHPLHRTDNGNWEIHISGRDALKHGQHIKLQVRHGNDVFDRVPAYIRYAEFDRGTTQFTGVVWAPRKPFVWTDGNYKRNKPASPIIYEAHVGMAQEYEGIGSYREFADNILPRIVSLGYNSVQLMAILEHPYYASFGYQVSNFFAPSSRFGTPDDLKYLINKAHGYKLCVLLDIVHSHSCANVGDGLNRMDGSDHQYFIEGERGIHPAWKTLLFDYAKPEVLHFLLSNLKYWQEEFHFDGFRFDGVTSMLYHDHGLGVSFSSYDQYFSMNTDVAAVSYLQIANELIHEIDPYALTIAEDMSGMPGMCIPIRSGGIGFDYRLSMGLPDFWIRMLKDKKDEEWDIYKLWFELTTRRPKEKNIGYCESHDQALVGDKTLIFRMADAQMYTSMCKEDHTPVIDRAVDMHKLIRFSTLVLGCDGYLNFMGNEFGHPEWIDFPREGNGWSYHYARRQWSLTDCGLLKYSCLEEFDRDMLKFARKFRVLSKPQAVNLWIDQAKKLLAFSKGELLYLFNFNTAVSEPDFFLHAHTVGEGGYRAVFSSDAAKYGGQDRINLDYIYKTEVIAEKGMGFRVYIPARTVVVFRKVE